MLVIVQSAFRLAISCCRSSAFRSYREEFPPALKASAARTSAASHVRYSNGLQEAISDGLSFLKI